MTGNVWEMVRGLRIKDGQLEMAKNNDAALDIDLTLEGDNWEPVRDDSGRSIRVSVSDGGIKFLAESDHEDGIITEDEKKDLNEVISTLDEVSRIAQSLKIWAEKNLE